MTDVDDAARAAARRTGPRWSGKTEVHTIQVGDEHVPFDAVIGRNVPERVDPKEEDR